MPMKLTSGAHGLRRPAALLTALLALAACDSIKEDKFTSQGGISPDPSAVLEGSILYVGPHPTCLYKPDGSVERIVGNVVMTMFEYDNPPPPEGQASSAVNLFFVSGDQLFSLSDCLPDGTPPNYQDTITRSAAFVWSGVQLQVNRAVDYQIRGFYDYDEDMIPLFSVTRLPTQGDIAGGAVNSIQDANKGFRRISLPKQSDGPNGVIYDGITVALGQPVWTERSAFRLDENRALAATSAFNPALVVGESGSIQADGPATLRKFRALTCKAGSTDGSACGMTLQRLGPDDAPKLAASRIGLDLASPAYGFFAEPVDIKTVVLKAPADTSAAGGLDLAIPDGKPDPHPFLGSGLGINWYSPMVILQRRPDPQYAAIEAQARIPPVLMVGSVLLGDNGLPTKSSYLQSGAPISIPPVAAVELIPGRTECRVPYFPPGTISVVTDGRLGNCDELPTGHYATNVLGGIAGGVPGMSAGFPSTSDSPFSVTGGRYSGQSWSLPNELGDPAQVSEASLMPDQGFASSFVVHDPTPADKLACTPSTLQGLCAAGPEIIENAVGVDSTLCLVKDCCAYVSHLCGLPLCEKVATADGNIAASPSKITGTGANGAPTPDCVPFEMPWQCCRAAP
ncbi:MAG: hypothetical protein JWN48_1114 [Myxococcaceae bacterium]|nr:hypothetical protein [Myxococcaceae bacterium]